MNADKKNNRVTDTHTQAVEQATRVHTKMITIKYSA